MLISALMIGFCSAYASAATPVWLLRAKAGICAAMLAAQLVTEPIQLAEMNAVEQAVDPLNIVDTIYESRWEDYIDRSAIVVRPDVVTIDGVQYSEIWLGPDATDSLRLSGFDFLTAYNIANNQDTPVSYAEGAGYLFGDPAFEVDGFIRTPTYVGTTPATYSLGTTTVIIADRSVSSTAGIFYDYTWNDGVSSPTGGNSQRASYDRVFRSWLQHNSSTSDYCCIEVNRQGQSYGVLSRIPGTSGYVADPFEFDYTSGVLDAPIADEDGLLLRVPSSYDDGQQGSVYNYDIHDLINLYPEVNDTHGHELVFDPSLNPDFEADIDMGNMLGDLITAVILAKLADLLGDNSDVIYAPEPEKRDPVEPGIIDPLPDPDPAPEDPVPGTTIADTDWTKLDEILRWIQSTIDSIRHLTESLQTMLDNIIEGIRDIMQQIAEIPEAIRELADKILEDIELGPAKLFDKALDILKTLFLPLLIPIRAMMNLWHYVVEWIQSISTPFTWIFGIMSGTSGNMVLPIYALLAGGICISIYKALGR